MSLATFFLISGPQIIREDFDGRPAVEALGGRAALADAVPGIDSPGAMDMLCGMGLLAEGEGLETVGVADGV